uniref:Laccase-2 (Diphenol oxidase 2) (Urishiol oxidase 2)) n=1 Tax=Ganoderma boninense TaxID=34458 RepID=A0A5K1K6X9_9APHY|nr:Laccase-2 (EC (Benzenediol:oxygen oxidoreductase 2) (Diphenol oxidase 2) (Urishiol oxidase 2) [Ganoderma boninense]
MLDLSEMRRRYGLSRPSLQPLSATTEAETVTFPVLSSTESDDGFPRSKNVVLCPRWTPPRRADPDEDISVVGGILSDVGDLMDLFRAHATHPLQDKACDQFEARQHEIVFRPVLSTSTSTSGTTSSSQQPEVSSAAE